MQQCVYETKICDICDLQNRLTPSWVDFEQNVIEAAIDERRDPHVCVLVADTWKHVVKFLFICIMWFIRTFYETKRKARDNAYRLMIETHAYGMRTLFFET